MEYDLIDTHCADEGVPSIAQEHIPTEQSTPSSVMSTPMYSEISVPALAAQYQRELSNDRQGEPYSETYAVELFRRATVQGNQEAREAWQAASPSEKRGGMPL